MAEETTLPPIYLQESLLGRGSFGTVYLVRHRETGDCFALKEFRTDRQKPENLRREMSNIFSVNHPNVVRCVGVEYGQDGCHFLVLEYANHGSLRDRLRASGKFSLPNSVRILQQVAQGLEALHQHGVVHRDLKPENILLNYDQGRITYKISDFGIARQTRDTSSSPTTSGSPSYMAPEQFVTESVYSSDLYSAGIIFYELLVGRRPYAGDPKELFMHHFRSEPDLSPIENPHARELIRRLLGKEPLARGHDGGDLVKALNELSRKLEVPSEAETLEPDILVTSTQPADTSGIVRESVDETAPWRLKLRQEWFLAGARSIAAPEPDGHHIYVGDGEFTARLDISTGREQQQFLLEDLAVASTATPGSRPGFIATTKRLYECRPDRKELIPRFDLPPQTRALAIGPEGKNAFAATERALCCFSIDGRQHWFREIMNYLLPAQLLIWNSERIFISSGPHAPRLHIFDFEGDLLRQVDLQRPILAMLKVAPDLSEMLIVESGFADQLPARLRRIDQDGIWQPPRDLAEGIFQSRWHSNCLSLFGTNGRLQVISTNAEPLLDHTEPGEIIDAAWQPESGFFSTIIRRGNRTLIRSYEVQRS